MNQFMILMYFVLILLQAGFRYHHAEPDYLMLVQWISNEDDTIPANASHRVAIGAFVMNTNREVIFWRPIFFFFSLASTILYSIL